MTADFWCAACVGLFDTRRIVVVQVHQRDAVAGTDAPTQAYGALSERDLQTTFALPWLYHWRLSCAPTAQKLRDLQLPNHTMRYLYDATKAVFV
ncbi:MAG: hypothetical protein HY231_24955 [Acidobacteria bacterium]|nr:hypothetical protein [Acidobacteriota bacterium]